MKMWISTEISLPNFVNQTDRELLEIVLPGGKILLSREWTGWYQVKLEDGRVIDKAFLTNELGIRWWQDGDKKRIRSRVTHYRKLPADKPNGCP